MNKKLFEIGKVKNGYAFKSSLYSRIGKYRVITISNVQQGRFLLEPTNKIIEIPNDIQPHQILKKEDILISLTGNVGRVCKVSVDNCLLNQRVGLFQVNDNINLDYVYHSLNNKKFQSKMEQEGKGAAQKNLSIDDINNFAIFLPSSYEEQEKIAKALTSIEKTILAIEKLIQKKEYMFKGVMQELLTGNRRLPGFSKKWVSHKLAKCGKFYKGKGISKNQIGTGNIPCIRYGELYTKYDDVVDKVFSFISEDVAKKSFKIYKNDIVFTGSGETAEEIGKATSLYCDFKNIYASSDTVVLRLSEEYDSNFMAFYLNSYSIVKQKASLSQGHTVVHLTSKQLKDIDITIPSTKDEQKAIFDCLLNFRKDIKKYKEKLIKLENIKKGMEEQLLTGKIRLPLN